MSVSLYLAIIYFSVTIPLMAPRRQQASVSLRVKHYFHYSSVQPVLSFQNNIPNNSTFGDQIPVIFYD